MAFARVPHLTMVVISMMYTQCHCIDEGGWSTSPDDVVAVDGPCNLPIEHASSLTYDEFMLKSVEHCRHFDCRYADTSPVIIRGLVNDAFRERSTRDRLLADFGDSHVQLASANTYSYKKVSTTFGDYIRDGLRPQNASTDGASTLYLFGYIDREEWSPLLDTYIVPPFILPDHEAALSFGVAGAGTGVPFHFHGPGFAEVVYGSKRWFLYPYERRPAFDPDTTTLKWYREEYPLLDDEHRPLECLMTAGEAIYFPSRWWHATLNSETSVFVSTFLAPTAERTEL